ncbi:peptidase M24 [Leifsonia sp. ALI-44-B]|uniref:M24 family metallopeptidase n=1 Tax=Leifsonia sp. ALI-44-B TaxID=1933776 RepID=UPI00097C8115|nr:Xaa-Pro peptidase family protein [Leifsonia sp. ALI-44-B]ONI61490.1 peptidase M24 [Leifsonia sp. ALI-44-B]
MVFTQRLGSDFFETVQRGVIERLKEAGLDAVVTADPEDVAYLTGFFHHPGERPVVVWLEASGRCVLLLPALEREHAESQSAHAELVDYPEFPGVVSPWDVLAERVRPVAVSSSSAAPSFRVGHSTTISYERLVAATRAFSFAALEPTDVILRSRFIKQPGEIELHREAARITDRMLDAGVRLVRDAVVAGGQMPSEAELAAHVGRIGTGIMYDEHADVVVGSFLAGGLVYSGANSSKPHGLPSSYRLRPGDTFMLSLGCAVGGRFVEGERTFVMGEPTASQIRYHDAIYEAQKRGRETIRAGLECREANELCLDVIRDAGLGEYILHRQGHGIGLGMHEPPWLEAGDATVLEAGMVVSNEPGIYVTGHAGYRISDSMLVTAEGAEPLTSFPRRLDDCLIEL